MKNYSESYKSAGVDVNAGYKAVELMKDSIDKTLNKSVLSGIGGFGGLFQPDLSDMKCPVLVSGTDGVGTKLKIAFLLDKHDSVGIDCVAMCVNDIVCCGATPLFFLDYVAVGKNFPEKVAQIVSGVAQGCVLAGCALIGGETAEMPGFYPKEEYDLAGFSVGMVDKSKILSKDNVECGDVIIALPSSGIHSNGFSLVRKVFDVENKDITKHIESLGCSLGDALITPTKIYVKPVLEVLKQINVKSIAHITGGGFYENIPRALPDGKMAQINISSIKVLPVFELIMQVGNIPQNDMFSTFNMGVGMVLIVSKNEAEKSIQILKSNGENAYAIGSIVEGECGVMLC